MITGAPLYDGLIVAGLAAAALTVLSSFFLVTPYGRFHSSKAGPSLPTRTGWFVMEAPAPIAFAITFALGPDNTSPVALFFAVVWFVHYGNRAFLFPLLMQTRPDSRMSWSVVASGVVVTSVHGWLYATWLVRLGGLGPDWFTDPRFALGLALWIAGFAGIVSTEHLLRRLRADRKPGDDAYRIPHGGGFRWVSSPHYLGEILAFTGLMIATWCPGGLVVWSLTLANLVPRAKATHAWYREHFDDYPDERRALIPYVW